MRISLHHHLRRVILAVVCSTGCIDLFAQNTADYELPPIEYSKTQPSNCVSILQERLQIEALRASVKSDKGFVHSLLKELDVPTESQVLVFSRTSLQRKRIRPDHPRALFFSDDCYVGWVPGGLIETVVTDPKLGLVFYQVDPHDGSAPPKFQRDGDCLSCHAGSMTRDWPGLMVRSVYADERGEPILPAGTFLTEHDSPLANRWGGWYVTGKHGAARHMGNATAFEKDGQTFLDRESGANITDLSKFIDPEDYLRSDSDIVALMVLEHQVGMHNRLCKAALNGRRWLEYQRQIRKELGEPPSEEPTGTALTVVRSEAESIVQYLLFSGEIDLPAGGIQGGGDFQKAFSKNRHTDSHGRSLKDFDLQKHLFKYRCSYMIYSQAFDALPKEVKMEVYRQLYAALCAPQVPSKFAYLTDEQRRDTKDILTATKPELAEAWKKFSAK